MILPLLDGLDEVRAESREACVTAINKFQTDYGSLGGIVVCSRVEDYNMLKTRLKLHGAILIQPLTPDQVNDWLNAAGDKLASLRSALTTDATLRELTHTPLMLTVMGLAYQNRQVEITTDTSVESRRKQIFGAYVDQMFKRVARTKSQLYSRQQTMKWLAWLAKKMQAHGQSVFLVDGLQPSWMRSKFFLWLYLFLSRFISAIVIIDVVVGILSSRFTFLLMPMVFGLFWAVVDALFFVRGDFPFKNVIRILVLGFGGGLAYLSVLILSQNAIGGWVTVLLDTLEVAIICGSFFGLYSVGGRLENDIRFLETLGWSWRRARLGSMIGFGGGLAISIISTLATLGLTLVDWSDRYPMYVVVIGSFIAFCCVSMPGFGLVGISIGALFGGIVSKISQEQSKSSWMLKLRNIAIIGVWVAFIASLASVITLVLEFFLAGENILSGVTTGISFGILVGVLAMFWFGIFSAIRHFTLRFILTFSEHIPFNLSRFLDHAVDRIFMQRVGSGYIFIHRALLEYFAEQ